MDPVVVVTEPTFMQQLWESIQAPVLLLLTSVVTVVVGLLATKLNTFLNVKNETQAKANEMLLRQIVHDAAWSAAKWASQKAGVTLMELQTPGLPPEHFVKDAISYIRSKNPDAAAGIPDKDLGEIIVSKIPDLIKVLNEGETKT